MCLFIFSGGETIRNIINMCGAHVELNRAIPESAPTKYFIIRGTPLGENFFLFCFNNVEILSPNLCFFWGGGEGNYSEIVGHDQGKTIHLER